MPAKLTLIFILAFAPSLYADATNELLMGSVVRSDKWTIDRTNDLELFDGNVSFRNADYNLKADHAVYDRKELVWTIRGSVYCLRKFPDGSNIELNCDHGTYNEDLEEAELFRGKEPIRMKSLSADGKLLKGRSDAINADNMTGIMDFLGSFYLQTENMEIFSANGSYNDDERSFLIYGSTPVALGTRNGRDFAMTGEKIKYFRDTGDLKLNNNVAGWVKAVKEPQQKK